MPSGELMSDHVKHYAPADPRQRAQVGDGFLGSIGDAAAGAAGAVGGLAGLSAATGIGVPAAVAEGTLAAGLGATGACCTVRIESLMHFVAVATNSTGMGPGARPRRAEARAVAIEP